MSTGVIFSILFVLRSVRHEIESAVSHQRVAQPRGIDHDARRYDEIDRLGKLLDLAVDRVSDARGEIDNALQERPIRVLQVDDDDLAIAQGVGDLRDVLIAARRKDANLRSAATSDA